MTKTREQTDAAEPSTVEKDLQALLDAARAFAGSVDIGGDARARFDVPFSAVHHLRAVVATIDARKLGALAANPVTYEDRDRERFGASLLEAVLNPGLHPLGADGSLMRSAQRLGLELAQGRLARAFVKDLVDELAAIEWGGQTAERDRCCPRCLAIEEGYPVGQHADGCTLDAKLTQAGLVSQEQRGARRAGARST